MIDSLAAGLPCVMTPIGAEGLDLPAALERCIATTAEATAAAIGHLHNDKMLQAVQKRCQFAPGEFIVVWIESEPILRGVQKYWVMDAAVGIVERGCFFDVTLAYDEAFAILQLNETQYPGSSNLSTFRGNINLIKGDTAAAIAAFREAVRRDSTNGEAQNRLRQLTRP